MRAGLPSSRRLRARGGLQLDPAGMTSAFRSAMRFHKILWLPLLAGCATAPRPQPKGGPRGLRASEHLEAARDQDELAKQASTWHEPAPVAPGGPLDTMSLPWVRSWDTADEHERLAAVHRSKAAELEAEYEDACGSRS